MSEPETKEKLLEAAVDLFAARGFSGTSIRDIANAMGMSIFNIYHYFGSKDGLLMEIFKNSSGRLLGTLRDVAQRDMPPLEKFELLVRTHLKFVGDYRNEAKIYTLDEEQISKASHQISQDIQREILNLYVTLLKDLDEKGFLRTQRITVLAFNILAVMNWMLRWYREDGQLSLDEVCEEILSFVLHGALRSPAA
ncbi:MAG: TetR/AcrR family transcriptional regulator [Deltaproteobacteria bacterium]|nr:TetR/AcrR family transcriptional regulator [Deltaproteobacteria bacterium]